jgi:hypothetical protein
MAIKTINFEFQNFQIISGYDVVQQWLCFNALHFKTNLLNETKVSIIYLVRLC